MMYVRLVRIPRSSGPHPIVESDLANRALYAPGPPRPIYPAQLAGASVGFTRTNITISVSMALSWIVPSEVSRFLSPTYP